MAMPEDDSSLERVEYLSTRKWRQRTKAGELGLGLLKASPGNLTPGSEFPWSRTNAIEFDPLVPGEDHVLRRIISSDRRDRYGDVVKQEGIDLDGYHGQVLWGHDSSGSCGGPPMLPIGRTLRFEAQQIDGFNMTVATALFDKDNPIAEMTYRSAKNGFCPDSSIGFTPKPDGWQLVGDEDSLSYIFNAWWLYEWSLVPVGANTDATQQTSLVRRIKRSGVDLSPLEVWAREALDLYHGEAGLWVPRESLEAVVKELGYGKGVKFFEMPVADIRAQVGRKVRAFSPEKAAPADAPPSLVAEAEVASAVAGSPALAVTNPIIKSSLEIALERAGITTEGLIARIAGFDVPVGEEPAAVTVADSAPAEPTDDELLAGLIGELESPEAVAPAQSANELEAALAAVDENMLRAMLAPEIETAVRRSIGRLDDYRST